MRKYGRREGYFLPLTCAARVLTKTHLLEVEAELGGALFLYGSPAKLWICHLKLLAAQLGLDFKQHISYAHGPLRRSP